jgi:copper chaperone CopZ
LFLAVALCVLAVPAFAESEMPGHDHPAPAVPDRATSPTPTAHQAIIQVNGLVCSFCAHGVEKALSKLEGLDREQYGDGVLVEIEDQRVTLALQPGAAISLDLISESIIKGGYDPVRYDLRVSGYAMPHGDHWVVHATEPKANFALASVPFAEAGDVELLIHVDAAAMTAAKAGAPIPAVLDEVL